MSELTKTRSPWWRSIMAGARRRTSRWAPEEVHLHGAAKRLGDVSSAESGTLCPALDTRMSIVADSRLARHSANVLHRVAVGQVEGEGVRLATLRRRISPRDLLAPAQPPGAEHHRVTAGGQGPRRGQRRSPRTRR